MLAVWGRASAQAPIGACPPNSDPYPPVNALCSNACIMCDIGNGYSSQTPIPILPPTTIESCETGNAPIILDNPNWQAFIMGPSPFVEFGIKALNCSSGSDLEAAILTTCPTSGPAGLSAIACATIDANNSSISASLIPGQIYYLVIDGLNGAQCKFDVNILQGNLTPPQLGDLGTIQGPTQVCPKATATYTIQAAAAATSYTWTSPPGSKINGGTNSAVIPAGGPTFPIQVEIEFGTQGGNICVTATAPCDTPKTTCIQVTNQAIPITVLPDELHCYEELPYVWPESPNTAILAPGIYTLTSSPYQSYLGCDSIVQQKIRVLPFKYKVLPTTYICEPNCFEINGNQYCNSGTYLETLTTADGCDSTINFTIVKVPVNAVVQQSDTITCAIPSVVLTSEGSTTGNTVLYTWINPAGQIISYADTAVAISPGTYTFIVTNLGGGGSICKDTATVVVPAETTVPLANAGPDKVLSCAQPTVQLQGSGSVGPQFTYLWIATNGGNIVSGSTTLTPTVNMPGNYILRVTNTDNGCTAINVAIVTAQTLPPSVSASGGTYTCSQPNVALQVTTNAVSPTFAWSGPNGFTSAQKNPSVNVAGNYIVVVTDSITGCTSTATAIVVDNTQPPGAAATGDTLTCVVNSVTLNGSSPASGTTFAWSGPNGFTSSEQNPTATVAGNYLLTVTGTNGCTSTATATVLLNNTPPGATVSASGNLNCNNASVNLVSGSNPPVNLLNHTWTLPDNSTVSTGSNPVLNANQPGPYSVLITNTLNGCTSTANVTVIQNPNVTAAASATLASCNGSNDGSVTVTPGGGNGTYSYLWNTGAANATVNNLGAGTYTVTVTDGENCTATATATVSQPEPIAVNASATPQTANGAADGTASAAPAGGTPGYTYIWSNGGMTATITGLLPGPYTVTVTDINGCTAVALVNVNAYNCTASASVESENVSCAGANDGSATITISGGQTPFTYLWSNGAMTSSVDNLAPGSYTATATDAANCPVELLVQITEPAPLVANASATNASGPTSNDGSATAGPTGGTPPYSYQWTTGGMTATITDLLPGTYTVTVMDANNCSVVQSVEVLAGNCGILSDFLVENPSCNGLADGEATILLTGGVGPFTYAWSSDGDEATETGLTAGTYTVSVTDANGCEIKDSVTLTDPDLLTIESDTVINTSCVNTPEGSATVSVAGGTGQVTILWSDGQTGPTASGLPAGDITATATDENGCTATVSVTIDAVDQVPPVITANPVDVPLGPTGNITLTPQILGVTVTDNCAVSSVTLVPTTFDCTDLGPQTIEVTATDDSGNTSTTSVTATIIDNLPPTTECPPSIIRCFGDNVVQYNAPVATDNCLGNGGMWELTAGLPSGATFPLGVTTNTYTYTDAGGNEGACSFEVNILSQLIVTATITNDVDSQNVGAINLTVTGGLSPYMFQWTKDGAPFATTEDLMNIGPGNYSVVVTDDFGCTVASETFPVLSMIDTDEPSWASGLYIFPNPTSGHVVVVFPDGVNEEVMLTVFDVTGRRVAQQVAASPKQMDLDLSALPGGVYPVLLRVENETIARRIVVNR
ncbi:MAG: hypothetical protein EPGJADBJ_00033 [Saprospiraceae bacterium]|nr:hypothetical protein [Saprospiraceae bacterium]